MIQSGESEALEKSSRQVKLPVNGIVASEVERLVPKTLGLTGVTGSAGESPLGTTGSTYGIPHAPREFLFGIRSGGD